LSLAQFPAPGRPASNLRKKLIVVRNNAITLDTLSIIPNSFSITGIADTTYLLDEVNAILRFRERPPLDTLFVTYRVFSHKLNAVTRRLNFDSIQNNFLISSKTLNDRGKKLDERFFNFGNINYNGSFGRGIAFGNAQDAVVTSTLNLQINGMLADSIEIAAAITDNNIPIQPDGTTQQLNEFDRIFLQFKKDGWQLNLGDIDLRQSNSYFLNFYKRLQGVAFQTTSRMNATSSNTTLLSGSIAKGKFTRNIFQGQEGNQGPYRLTSANNELFFVVLANTERVFIDGELMQRGEDQDYVINYNTAEVTFTPRRMITKDSRIQVEFEYADRNYLNTNLFLSNESVLNDKLKVRISAFSNADAKSSPINQNLDAPQKQFLHQLGDSVFKAFYPVAGVDTFELGKILYKKIDTTFDGTTRDSIYQYSSHPDSARYSLSFIDVGQGNGDYIPDFSGANGKVYKWVAPVNNIKQGRFEPATYLVTPKKQQVVSFGVDYTATKNTTLLSEFAYSNYDVNSFSSKDKGNDKGYAARLLLKNTLALSKNTKLLSDGAFEYVDARFKPLERLRTVEFYRDWGLPYVVLPEREIIYNGGLQLLDARKNSLKYQFTSFARGDHFRGYRNSVYHTQAISGWTFNNQLVLSDINSRSEKGYFFRPTLDVSKQLSKIRNYTIGSSFRVEHNELHNRLTDSVTLTSFSFQTFQVYVKSSPTKLNRWGITYFTRSDRYPSGKELVKADRSQNINVFTELLKSDRHQFRINITYRDLDVINSTVAKRQPDRSLLSRAEYQVNEWKGLITGNVLYEVGAGQEQKRDYAFLEVPAGQGQYVWNDYDNNGIQSLNEFEVALFQDQAKYIRIFTPTNEFIKASYNTFNYSVNFSPRSVIDVYKAKGIKLLLSKISLQSSLQLFKKETSSGLTQLNPFSTGLTDTSLISLNSILMNSFSFNRFSTKWGLDINNLQNSGKALLTYGYESRRFDEWTIRGRLNFTKNLSLDIILKEGKNTLATSNVKFDNRNYELAQRSAEPRLSYTRGGNFRIITGYRFAVKNNQVNEMETYEAHSLNSEVKYNILQSSSILGKFTFSNIAFSSRKSPGVNSNSTVSYIMLEGLMPGKNYLWNIDLTKRLTRSLEMTIQYEGRKPGTAKTVHVGRASLRAIL
jgi:hypothetical protein